MGASPGSYFRNAWNIFRNEHQLTLRKGKHSWLFSTEATHYQLNTFEHEAPSGYMGFGDFLTGGRLRAWTTNEHCAHEST